MVFQYIKNADNHFVCPYCNVVKKNQNTMYYHMKKHEGSLPHTCKHCSKKFLHKNMLDLHITARHPETTKEKEVFACPVDCCAYESLTKANRIIHFMRVHCKDLSNEKKVDSPGSKLSCKQCIKEFNNSTSYYYHAAKCFPPAESHAFHTHFTEILV